MAVHRRASAIPRAYLDAVVRAGGQPVVVDPAGDLVPLLDRVDALVLSGGPDVDPACYGEVQHAEVYGVDRAADEAELALARAAVERATPTLAICRGLQVLNVALGGTLYQHIPDLPGIERHGRPGEAGGGWEHGIDVLPESLLASVFGTTRVTGSCHHHQAVGKVGDGPPRHRHRRRRHRRRPRGRRHVAPRGAVASRGHRGYRPARNSACSTR